MIMRDGGIITANADSIDFDGLVIPRAELAEKVSDVDRFVRWMPLAQRSLDPMRVHKAIPPWTDMVTPDSQRDWADLLETLYDLQRKDVMMIFLKPRLIE